MNQPERTMQKDLASFIARWVSLNFKWLSSHPLENQNHVQGKCLLGPPLRLDTTKGTKAPLFPLTKKRTLDEKTISTK
jgi:hypothetical protein